MQSEIDPVSPARHLHMIIAGREIGRVGEQWGAMICLHDVQPALRVEPFRERARELGRHVLHDDHGHSVPGRERRKHFRERTWSTG